MKILVVEDEKRLAKALVQILKEAKYQAEAVFSGDDGLHYARTGAYDLLVLDVMLPGLDGFSIVRRLRKERIEVPILMLTAKTTTRDKVTGLDAGADDYLTKPFDSEELLARVRALLRRGDNAVADEMRAFDLRLSLGTCTLCCADRNIQLSKKEFQIMRVLMNSLDRYISKDELLLRAWDMAAEASDNCVEAYISFLRKKLAYLKSHTSIVTLRMVGYRLEEST